MIYITNPNEIIWKQIDKNKDVTSQLIKISNLLKSCDELTYNSVSVVVDCDKNLSHEELNLIKFALKVSGWLMTLSFRYDDKDKVYLYTYVLKPINTI